MEILQRFLIKIQGTKPYELSAYNFGGNMVFYQSLATNNYFKEHLFMEIKKAAKCFRFDSLACKMTKLKKITCAIISIFFIPWFTSAVIGSLGVITNRIRTTTVGSFVTLIDV